MSAATFSPIHLVVGLVVLAVVVVGVIMLVRALTKKRTPRGADENAPS
jgi:hypothetical protein